MNRAQRRKLDPDAPPRLDMATQKRKALRKLRDVLIASKVPLPARPTEDDIFAAALAYASAHPAESAAWADAIKALRGPGLVPRSGVTMAAMEA